MKLSDCAARARAMPCAQYVTGGVGVGQGIALVLEQV